MGAYRVPNVCAILEDGEVAVTGIAWKRLGHGRMRERLFRNHEDKQEGEPVHCRSTPWLPLLGSIITKPFQLLSNRLIIDLII